MTSYFVSRHIGALAWARAQALPVDRWRKHLYCAEIEAGDRVIGTLPVHLAAEVCAAGAEYWHLCIDQMARERGQELSAEELSARSVRIVRFHIEELDGWAGAC